MTPKIFQRYLLNWFDLHGRKHLPWQQNKTPYRVWISEIMLQQTQVSTVIPYFKRFMLRFPDVYSLAKATEDEVLHLFAGLGYYSRARNLHHAAKKIVNEYGGKFPDTLTEMQSLPGIGKSTAGAILSIAFNKRATILDGNVKRVLSRLHCIQEPINEKITENKLWLLAEQYTPKLRVADFTQAMMDLGATLCTRKNPQCEACPFVKKCEGFRADLVTQLPIKKASKKIPVKEATLLILKKGNQVLLNKRPSKGIWGGLFSLPEINGKPELKYLQAFFREQWQLSLKNYQTLPSFRHTFTHYHLDIHPILILINKKSDYAMVDTIQVWYNLHHPETIGLPKPIQMILRDLQ